MRRIENRERNPAFGQRLEQAIAQMWPSKGAFAQVIGVHPQNLSRYLGGRIPAGDILVKLADALPGRIEWILTGREPTGLERASMVSEAVRQMLEMLDELSPAQQQTLAHCGYLLVHASPQVVSGLEAYADNFRQLLDISQEMRRSSPDVT